MRNPFFFLSLAILIFSTCHTPPSQIKNYKIWETYRGSKTAHQYSALSQINKENVANLEVAWTYQTGGNTKRSTIQCNPIIIGQTMYITSPDMRVIALEAATGKEIWQFNPNQQNIMGGVNRGVTYWESGKDRRILFTARHLLFALDANSGKIIESFGENGQVDMRNDLGIPPEKVTISSTSPGIIYGDLIIFGSTVGEGYSSSPGHIRAYDVKTGELAWIFHTIPQAGEYGYEDWEIVEGQSYGGANAWGGLSLDEQRGWVFAATGSIAFDFYGGGREGKNLFANCIIAINATTGERIWHYQVVRHDLWDYDLPCAPNLVTIPVNGKEIDAVVQPTKMGYFFLLDRETGEPLYPIEERAFPASGVPGEKTWPTQPIPTFPDFFVESDITEDKLSNISKEANEDARKKYQTLISDGLFIPPSFEGTISMPGTRGGAEWSGASFDPETDIIYVNANEIASIFRIKGVLVDAPQSIDNDEGEMGINGKALYQQNCATCHGLERKGYAPTYPSLTNLSEKYRIEEIKTIIANGRGSMPAFAQFSEKEQTAIAEFLHAENTEEEAISGNGTFQYLIDGYRQFKGDNGYPANRPPWGSLNAIDLKSGKLIWKVPLGEYEDLKKKGIPPTGTQNLGGCVATAGGLVFVGASQDEKFRAFDKETGEILWEYQLPVGGYATPAIYEMDGKQYIVIAAGGGGKNGTKSGDFYMAFSLGENSE